MSLAKNSHSFRATITDQMIADRITEALRQEHAHIKAPVKMIERVTGIPGDTINKWHTKRYAPKSRHLLLIAAHYPKVLQAVCELMDRRELWQEIVRLGLVDTMYERLEDQWKNWKTKQPKVDKSVHIHVRLDARTAVQMNQRQLWFLGQLQQGYEMQAADIECVWHVHSKTARRDISGLLHAKLIDFVKIGRRYYYKFR